MANFDMNPDKFRSTMNSLNYGNVMQAAARNLQKELLEEKNALPEETAHRGIDMEDLEQARAL